MRSASVSSVWDVPGCGMAGTLMFIINAVAGLNFSAGHLRINPDLPARWKKVSFGFAFRKNYYTFELFREGMKLSCQSTDKVDVEVSGTMHQMDRDHPLEMTL